MNNSITSKNFFAIFEKPWVAGLIFGFFLALTFWAWHLTKTASEYHLEVDFDVRTEEAVRMIEERMFLYEQVLWGTVGLFNASSSVERDEFKKYVDTLNLAVRWPGIQGIGYAVPVDPAEKAEHIKTIQAEGFPEYTIKPEGERSEYSAIVYLEPFDWRNKRAFGYDMWSNDMRRTAMARARDEGIAATSGLITLVQETNRDVQKGFLTYTPVYKRNMPLGTVEERRVAFQGWVYSPFRCNDLMKNILGETETAMLDFRIYDEDVYKDENLLFSTSSGSFLPDHEKMDILERKVSVELQGRHWGLYFTSKKDYLKNNKSQIPYFIAWGGLIIDLLLFYTLYSIGYLKRRADKLAGEMTETIRTRNNALERSELLLKEKNNELEQFAYRTSHDLKSPLNSISGLIKVLKKEIESEGWDREMFADVLTRCENNADRLSTLVDDILNLSRASLVQVDAENMNLHVMLRDIQESLSNMMEGKSMSFFEQLDEPQIVSQKVRIRQILENLISNAIKYTGENAIVTVRSYLKANQIILEVTDNGLGIPESEHHKVFNMFHRAHPEIAFGSGLGLHLVKKHVIALQGEISFKSKPGETTFTIRIPHESS